MKKLFLICAILITILSISAVSAEDNTTDTIEIANDTTEISIDEPTTSQKRDLNPTIHYVDEAAKYAVLNDYYYLSIDGIDGIDYYSNVEIYVDGEHHGYYNSFYEMWPTTFSLGEHVITAKFNGNAKYNPFTVNHTFNVVKVAINIPKEITENQDSIMVRIADDATGSVTVYVNNTKYKTVKFKPDEYYCSNYISLKGLKFGTYDIKVVYSGDKKYPKTTKTQRVNVSYGLEAYLYRAYYKNNESGEIYLPKDAKNVPTAKCGDLILNVTKANLDEYYKTFLIDYADLEPGIHEIEITYPGDSKYPSKTITKSVEIDAKIEYAGYNTQVNESAFVILKLPDDAKGNLSITLNDKPYASVRPNIQFNFTDLDVGKYYFRCTYTGNDYYVESLYYPLQVRPVFTYPESMIYEDNETFYIDFMDNVTQNITYRYNNEEKTLEIINGKGNFSLADVDLDRYFNYRSEIRFSIPSKTAYPYECVVNVNIKPIPSKLVGGSDITMYYDGGNTYSLTVWGDYGKIVGANEIVTIKIGKKTYRVKTDANGVAKLKIEETPGKYTITATYHGAKVTNKLTVKQVITLKSATVKKSAKKLEISATLKGKNVLKNKPVTFKFNGKTYKAKTNAKGIAKVTIPKSILSKLKVGKTVTYQVTYLKNTVKKTAKVKK